MGRYTLIAENVDAKKIIVDLGQNGKKLALRKIDEYTVNASSLETLKTMLKLQRIYDIYITYKCNESDRKLPVAYSDKKQLTSMEMKTDSTIYVGCTKFKTYVNDFIRMLDEPNFYDYIMASKSVNAKLKDYLYKKVIEGDSSNFCISKIYEYFSNYKQFRDIIFLVEYYNRKKIENNQIDVEDIEDDEKEEFFSEEEKIKYKQYLESLPDDNYEGNN